jgi:hypothetical protein
VDLGLYARVLWRFRLLMVAGVVLALVLASVSFFRVGFDGLQPVLTHRQAEKWQNLSTLVITQQGFPEGRALFPPAPTPEPGDEDPEPYPYASLGRFTSLVDLYAQMANSDAVKKIMLRDGPLVGSVQAVPIPPATQGGASPLIAIIGKGTTLERATTMTKRGTRGLLTYLEQQQARTRIPPDERVRVRVLREADQPLLLEGRKKTLPIIVFLTIMSATVGLAFVLENARPRLSPVANVADERAQASRRSA